MGVCDGFGCGCGGVANVTWVLEWVAGGGWAPWAAMLGPGAAGLPVAEGRLRPR